jgi:ferrochelatase
MKDLLFVMYMGGPDSLDAIRPFLFNLFTDRDIINFKIGELPQRLLANIISKSRSKKVIPDYEKMGGKSPQLDYLRSLLRKVEHIYTEDYGGKLDTRIGMCYYHPFIEDTFADIDPEEYKNIYVTTMYPQYSYTTSGACFKRFYNCLRMRPIKHFETINFWHLNRRYNECLIFRIRNAAETLGTHLKNIHLFFSAHSLPEYTQAEGDYYVYQIKEQVDYLVKAVSPAGYSLGFQSRTGPMKWLGPETRDELNNIAEKGVDNIVVVPISFVSDHIETLIELDEQYISALKTKGVNIVRIESLNDGDDFAKAFVDIIRNGG